MTNKEKEILAKAGYADKESGEQYAFLKGMYETRISILIDYIEKAIEGGSTSMLKAHYESTFKNWKDNE